ncbi:Heat stress transcription factor A-1d [Tetrabaena socialis]|uniref:Heat stress transcription factor A-1d n=1 Tax=Tetrabaena socialis TaxID=47790 RepID=A0A2J8A2P9_9CHLO|nr:Heat stress transcription factor A-1d [Tetrabaena socialis]|eukprot:PNH06799.1 Heat stress transcription factor A-1d [Tetrabaena socialis]
MTNPANQPPPFLIKTYDLVDDAETESIVSWGADGSSFVVWKPPEFARDLLPKHFKHNNFSSFVRQLNTYGFRKVDPDRWEFANEHFVRGRKEDLRGIHRRKPSTTAAQPHPGGSGAATPMGAGGGGGNPHHALHAALPSNALVAAGGAAPAIELGAYGGFREEIDGLKRDKSVLMVELVRVRQQQQNSDAKMREVLARLESTEQKQQTMINMFAAAFKNPAVFQRMLASLAGGGIQRIAHAPTPALPLLPNSHPGAAALAMPLAMGQHGCGGGGGAPPHDPLGSLALHPAHAHHHHHLLSSLASAAPPPGLALPVNDNPTVSSPDDNGHNGGHNGHNDPDDDDAHMGGGLAPMDHLMHSLQAMPSGDLALQDSDFADDVWAQIMSAASAQMPDGGGGGGGGSGLDLPELAAVLRE